MFSIKNTSQAADFELKGYIWSMGRSLPALVLTYEQKRSVNKNQLKICTLCKTQNKILSSRKLN